MRLVEEEDSYSTYAEAYEINCARHGKEPDLPMTRFKQLCCADNGQLIPDPHSARREAVSTCTYFYSIFTVASVSMFLIINVS